MEINSMKVKVYHIINIGTIIEDKTGTEEGIIIEGGQMEGTQENIRDVRQSKDIGNLSQPVIMIHSKNIHIQEGMAYQGKLYVSNMIHLKVKKTRELV
jgi:hypothetical protein